MTLVKGNEVFTTEDITVIRAYKLNGWEESEVKAEPKAEAKAEPKATKKK